MEWSVSELNHRIEELEIRLSFHEDLLGTLNQHASRLSMENARLQADLKQVQGLLDEVRALLVGQSLR